MNLAWVLKKTNKPWQHTEFHHNQTRNLQGMTADMFAFLYNFDVEWRLRSFNSIQ